MYYFERKNFAGKWYPVISLLRPDIRDCNGQRRVKTSCGVGPEVRAIQPIPYYYRKLTLQQMKNVLSPERIFHA